MIDLQQAILAHVQNSDYQPVKPKVIAKKLGLNQDQAHDLKRVIKRLVKRGVLAYGANHLVMAASAVSRTPTPVSDETGESSDATAQGTSAAKRAKSGDPSRVTGVFRRMAGGFGFVRPLNTPRALGRNEDIFISAKNSSDASSGDTVLVRLQKNRRPGKAGVEGQIIEIVERETHKFVGAYFERGGMGLVDVDGKPFAQPIYVGDPGAKGAMPDDKVVIEIVRFPSHVHDGEGVIVEVLGARGAPGVDTLSIIREFDLPGDFSEAALDDARRQAGAFDESITGNRIDFTGETVLTIDPVDARDFDDAISLVKLENGHWRLGVHIADVSHFVQPKTTLDTEARDRATSVYLPDRVIPMLPEIISNNLASLQPDRVRYTLTAMIEMTAEGVRVACDVYKAAIKSRRRFTYEEVDEYLADRAAWAKKLHPDVHALLGRMHELAMVLRRRRFARGSLELSMPEVKIDLDREGRVAGAHLVQNTESHQIIEEFMLAANEAVADKLRAASVVFMRRIHSAPDPRKLQSLTQFVRELGFQTEGLENRFATQTLLDEVRDLPQQYAVNYAVLRSMQKAIYSPEEEGHYALASDCYCHFTSPIRRYPDLTIHRLLETLLLGKTPKQKFDDVAAQADHCSQREQRAEEAERELTKVKLLDYLSDRIGEEMDGIITGVENFGLFVQGVELPAEGMVHVSALADDYYRYDSASHTLAGHRAGNSFRLGDAVRVAVARVDVGRRELDFRLIGRGERPGKPKSKSGDRPVGARTRAPKPTTTKPKRKTAKQPRRKKG